ncbi:MAG: S46 family peptidase [Myxococcales bacterium]|nr:S46 family peptidase [Myxococcales bacterium]
MLVRGSIRRALVGSAALLAVGLAGPSRADEGQWMPKQIAQLDQAMLRAKGLRLDADALWNPTDGGLMRAVVNLSGCSAGFLSRQGLLATNHHCGYGAIQAASTVEHDYLKDGFYAPTQAEEIAAEGSTVKVLESTEDVTEAIRALAEAETDPAARVRAVERARSEMVAQCEAEHPGHSCQVAEFYNGHEYQLLRYLELLDVRLVFAPPSSIGNYGGEIDNWMWPRHAGDFTLLRAYVGPDGKPAAHSPDNVPYQPSTILEVSPQGVEPGEFVAILGYPGRTNRYLPAPEVKRQLEQFLPARVALYGEWIEVMERLGAADPEVRIKVAASLRGLANRHKNARGMIWGIERNGLLAKRTAEDEALARWAEGQGERYAGVLEGLSAQTEARRESFERDFVLENLDRAPNALAIALDLVRRAEEQAKPDLERRSAYQDRAARRLWDAQERHLRDYDEAVDRELMEVLFRRIDALPPEQRVTGFHLADVPRVLRATRVTDPAFVKEAFDAADAEALRASRDPMLVLAHELVDALEESLERRDRWAGELLVLGPRYFEMLEQVRGGPVYPDANGTLRFSHASVQGYSPRDGLVATPQTTVAGQVAKDTGEEPFDLPAAVREAAARAPTTYWADPGLGDVPVDFLSNGDTTGGNSGSPVIDGQGRLVGLNFDRVWENIAGDYGYDVGRSRNVIVDVRYLLWVLDEVTDAGPLLEELGVAKLRDAPPRTVPAQPEDSGRAADEPADAGQGLVGTPLVEATVQEPAAGARGSMACACRSSAGGPSWGALALVGLGVAATRRRRRRR